MNLALQEFQAMGIEARIVTEGGLRRLKMPDNLPLPSHLKTVLPEGEKRLEKDTV